MKIALRRATHDDIVHMYNISCAVHLDKLYSTMIPRAHYKQFRAAYTPNHEKQIQFYENIAQAIDDPKSYVSVAEVDGVVAGYAYAANEHAAWLIKSLFVLPEYQRKGIGRALFRASYNAATPGLPIELYVIAKNIRAKRMYEQEGFRVTNKAEQTLYGAARDSMRYYGNEKEYKH